jgi:chaperonin GroES
MATSIVERKSRDLTQYEPLGDFVLIEVIEEAADMIDGIVVPEIAKAPSNKGKVISIGEGRIIGNQLVPIPLKPGDVVLFSKYGAEPISLDGNDFLLLRYDEIKLRKRLVFA